MIANDTRASATEIALPVSWTTVLNATRCGMFTTERPVVGARPPPRGRFRERRDAAGCLRVPPTHTRRVTPRGAAGSGPGAGVTRGGPRAGGRRAARERLRALRPRVSWLRCTRRDGRAGPG